MLNSVVERDLWGLVFNCLVLKGLRRGEDEGLRDDLFCLLMKGVALQL